LNCFELDDALPAPIAREQSFRAAGMKLMSLASAIGLCLDVPTEFAKYDAEALVPL
jgi:hypothetical protein